jgi:NTE family protein
MIKAGLALSGGGARGAAHIGVLKALQEWDIVPAAISGTSAGSIVGVFYADGFSLEEISELLRTFEFRNKISLLHFRKGLFSLEPVERLLKNNLRSKNFDQLRIPFFATAANLHTGRPVVFSEGPIVDVIVASCSVPIVFPPVYINNIPYVDGGLSCNLPIEPLLSRAEKIVGVHVNPVLDFNPAAGFIENVDRTFNLFIRENMWTSIEKCHVFIEPAGLEKYHLFDYKHMQAMLDLGYSFVHDRLKKEDVLKSLCA